jgi:hypothetical protein
LAELGFVSNEMPLPVIAHSGVQGRMGAVQCPSCLFRTADCVTLRGHVANSRLFADLHSGPAQQIG